MRKKGQVQMQFNWIYVAIVGAIILAVFVNIAVGIKNQANDQLAGDALTYFDEIFTSVQASENTENSIVLPGLDLEVATYADNCYEYSIRGSDIGRRPTEYTSLFSPNLIKTRILSYSLGWDVPFRVNYFLYLTSPEIVYVSVGNNVVSEELPEHLDMETSNYNEFENENYYKVKFFSTTKKADDAYLNPSVNKLKDEDVSAIYINEGEKSITWYNKDKDTFVESGKTYYLDEPTLIAAIYSENLDSYECNMRKALERLNKFSTILKNRITEIKSSDLLPLCTSASYDNAADLLSQLSDATKDFDVSSESFNKISSIRDQLQQINTDINKRSCPTVY